MLVTNSLTHSCLVNLIDATLACFFYFCEVADSKLVEVVSVTHVDDEKRVDNSLVQIWKVLPIKLSFFCSVPEDKVSGFVQDFEVEISARF